MSGNKISRFELLLSQFPFKDQRMNRNDTQSFIRFFYFLYENTNIHYLYFVKKETLIDYLKYHRSKQFEIISFTQVIQDINLFILYLKNKSGINKEIEIDLSLKNTKLWMNL
ncbi:hypothetical protein ACFSCZ_19710 [Siminovitchia sediminis]|uniref:Core-binding (CB) domain-containing protein n=1 Tax=Siminovitchia sediminis TaxID=1274353 RepID=A0ABW4KRL2_9BACI